MNSPIENKRHSLAHLLAAAVTTLFPKAQITIGPAIENGFYYDIDFDGALSDGRKTISEEDFPAIEAKMTEILEAWSKAPDAHKGFIEKKVSVDEAEVFFAENPYKLELIKDIASKGEEITLYVSGHDSAFPFTDLCRGGHIENPADIDPKSYKLTKVAGAYWRGDEKNKMLTRIYGVAFDTQTELETYLHNQEEAKKRDHKKLGRELGLFTFSELVGAGLPLWTPKGTILREELNDYVFELRNKYGYQKVSIPHITKKDLYEKSGHWDKYKDDLFRITTRENHEYAMKPMNCPHHTQIFDSALRSYRDMPQRYCETTAVYRDEQSGELAGLSRVLCITQDDAHVFCRVNQIDTEVNSVWDIISTFYNTFGFSNLTPRLSRRNPATLDKYLGNETNWDLAEETLKKVIESHTSDWIDGPGEAAFYGPKIDFMADDAIGRKHQVATIQLDFVQPERFELSCINEKGEKENVVMLHVAIMGSIERFLSVMIEHFGGAFPVWLSPVQVKIVPIGERQMDYAYEVKNKLIEADIRVELDSSNESLGKKIRNAKTEKVPYVLVIGDKEIEAEAVTVEGRPTAECPDGKIGQMKTEDFIKKISTEIKDRKISS